MSENARRAVLLSAIAFLFIVLFMLVVNVSGALASSPGTPAETGVAEIGNRYEIAKILSVLESRRTDGKALEKAASKMTDMNKRSLRLMSSLCDRISAAKDTPAADLAYTLLTALLVLS